MKQMMEYQDALQAKTHAAIENATMDPGKCGTNWEKMDNAQKNMILNIAMKPDDQIPPKEPSPPLLKIINSDKSLAITALNGALRTICNPDTFGVYTGMKYNGLALFFR